MIKKSVTKRLFFDQMTLMQTTLILVIYPICRKSVLAIQILERVYTKMF